MKNRENRKTNKKVFILIIGILVCMNFAINNIDFFCENYIYAAGGSSHGSSGAFGDDSHSGGSGSDSSGTSSGSTGSGRTIAETVGNEFDYSLVPNDDFTEGENVKRPIKRVWSSLILVLQAASVAGIIFAGVRYMFASAEIKADIKASMIHLVIGMVIVFAASSVVGVVTGTFNNLVN